MDRIILKISGEALKDGNDNVSKNKLDVILKTVQKLQKLNITLYVNPDGCEWKRDKWNYWVKKYLKLSEKKMVKHANLEEIQLVC